MLNRVADALYLTGGVGRKISPEGLSGITEPICTRYHCICMRWLRKGTHGVLINLYSQSLKSYPSPSRNTHCPNVYGTSCNVL